MCKAQPLSLGARIAQKFTNTWLHEVGQAKTNKFYYATEVVSEWEIVQLA